MRMNEQQLAELKSLKTTLRCLVVSNPAAMDTNNLRREYKLEMGKNIPFFEYGYRDIVAFLKERCSDVFTFSGMPSNPTLTPVITKEIMHIDKFIAKQKVPNTKFHKPKRSRTYETQLKTPRTNNSYSWEKAFANKKYNNQNTQITKEVQRQDKRNESHPRENEKNTPPSIKYKSPLKDQLQNASLSPNSWEKSKQKHDEYLALNYVPESKPPESEADSGTHTSSSGKSEKGHKLFVSNLKELISKHPKGIWSVELQSKYRDCFGVELDYERRGYNCLVSMCAELTEVFSVYRPDPLGDWLLLGSQAAPPLQEQRDIKLLCLQRQARRAQEVHKEPETDDALPGIDFDPSMYPSDCLHFLESVPTLTLSKETQEDMLEVIVAEIADPSHFWFQLRGSEHSDAMEGIMDQMTDYYQSPEGAKRNMAAGAVRVGQYCAANFEGDWHRSVIVQILSKGMVKVRHIDYGTVESVCSEGLRYLPRVWAQLPAQALRGSLAKLAPAHAAARWPHSTARHFLHMVREKPLIAQILHIDPKEQIASMILVDTSSTEDIFINDELVAYGLAEPYFEEELSFDDMPVDFLLPTFDAFENGRAFNYGEKTALLNKGIFPEEVQDPTGVCGKPRKDPSKNLLHRRDMSPNRTVACALLSNSDLGSSLESLYCIEEDVSKSVTPQEEPLRACLPMCSSPNKAELSYHQHPVPTYSNYLQYQPQYYMDANQMSMLEHTPSFHPNQQFVNFSSHLPLQLPCNANAVMMPSASPILPPGPNPHPISFAPCYIPHFDTNLDRIESPIPNRAPRMITKKQYQGSQFTDSNPLQVHTNCITPPSTSNISENDPENQKQTEVPSEVKKFETEHKFPMTIPSNAVLETPPNFQSSQYTFIPNKSVDNSCTDSPKGPGSQYVIPQKRNALNHVTNDLAKCKIGPSPPTSPSANTTAFNFDLNAHVQLSSLDFVVLETLISTNPTIASDFLASIRARNNIGGVTPMQCPVTTVDNFLPPATTITASTITEVASTETGASHIKMSNKPPGF